ncbi:MAG: hypothetical protein EB045_05780 [Actinobacteria bacterium]|nr:hypothetical protein [Actinomycetota bacterium]
MGKQKNERHKEMTDHQKDGVVEPSAGISIDEEPGFLGNIGIPLEKILAEGDVPPEHGKGEEQHAHQVIVLHREEAA